MKNLISEEPILIVPDNSGIGEILSEILIERGLKAKLSVAGEVSNRLIYLAGLNDDLNTKDKIIDLKISENENIFSLFNKIPGKFNETGSLIVTVQDTNGDFGLESDPGINSWCAGYTAFIKTANLEWPSVSAKAIDIRCEGRAKEDIARAIAQELFEGSNDIEVGLDADDQRIVVSRAPSPSSDNDFSFPENPLILVTGGGRGVTVECLKKLSYTTTVRLAILGRTRIVEDPVWARGVNSESGLKKSLFNSAKAEDKKLKPKEIEATVKKILSSRELKKNLEILRSSAEKVEYYSLDITKPSDVKKTIKEIRKKYGPIHGIVHAAGVIEDHRIEGKTLESFRRVFMTKVNGLRNILDSTTNDPLAFLICFSSVAARFGNLGQVDYAMANEVLNKVCQCEARKRGSKCLVRSLNWGPWNGGMVNSQLSKHFKSIGVPLIEIDAGADMFLRSLSGEPGESVEIVIGGL